MGIPAIVGCGNATDILKTGREVTISCAEGVRRARLCRIIAPRSQRVIMGKSCLRTRTKILMNVKVILCEKPSVYLPFPTMAGVSTVGVIY